MSNVKIVKKLLCVCLFSNVIFHNHRYCEEGEKIVLSEGDPLIDKKLVKVEKEASKIDIENDNLGSIRVVDTISLKDEEIKELKEKVNLLMEEVSKGKKTKNTNTNDNA